MSTLKKQQHYVWKFYLKPWAIKNKIHCLRNGKSFNTSLDNIGQQRFFYKAKELGHEELFFIQQMIKSMKPSVSKSLSLILEIYNDIINSKDDFQIKCGIENLHSIVENSGKRFLNSLYLDDFDFLESDLDRQRFSLFLAVQYTRTNKMRKRQLSENYRLEKIDAEKIHVIMPFIIGEIIARWIYDKGKFSIIINHSKDNFITSDQPIFNLKADPLAKGSTKDIELFYPLTPKKAIHISEHIEGEIFINSSEVQKYNELIKAHSEEQIYGKYSIDI